MSLSFVASAVQTGTSDGGYEETPIDSKQVEDANKFNSHKPLFEQLRDNQEEEQAKQDDMQREMMRGTMALDEDDVAHLDALNKQKQARNQSIQQRTQDELALFRAARAERQQVNLLDDDDDNSHDGDDNGDKKDKPAEPLAKKEETTKATPSGPPTVYAPKIVVKKRKRRLDGGKDINQQVPKKAKESSNETVKESVGKKDETKKLPVAGGLGGLLSGYGSSSDESDQ